MDDDWMICATRRCGWQGTGRDYVWKQDFVSRNGTSSSRGHCPKCDGVAFYIEKPLFIPLRAEYFDAFERGQKHTEYRQRSPRWNADTCRMGRRVVLSRGYGKARRLTGVIVGFHYDNMPRLNIPEWAKLYPSGTSAACIKIKLDPRP